MKFLVNNYGPLAACGSTKWSPDFFALDDIPLELLLSFYARHLELRQVGPLYAIEQRTVMIIPPNVYHLLPERFHFIV